MFFERTHTRNIPPAVRPWGIKTDATDGGGTAFWMAVLAACNTTLLLGRPSIGLVFFPDAILSGQWWRLFTFPFVHVSGYHLLLDGAAFLLLWKGLQEKARRFRAVYLAGCWAGSLILPLATSDLVAASGLCGLSGISHGLMGITALEMISHPRGESGKDLGAALLLGLAGKCLWEMYTGKVMLASFHLGSVGMPVVETHAGGLMGGVLAFFLLWLLKQLKQRERCAYSEDKE